MKGRANVVLALETTTEVCSVALVSNGHWLEDTRFAPRLHNRHLLAMVDNVLGVARVERQELDVIAFGAGPGSFTGVRIGAAVAQGIALAVGARVLPIPSSAVTAEGLRRCTSRRGPVTLARVSRPGWRYVARYELQDTGIRCLQSDELLPDDHDPALIVGYAMNARLVGELALADLSAAVPPAAGLPLYVEGNSPWRPARP